MADQEWGPPFDVHTEEVTFDSAGVTISASFYERERPPVAPPPEGKKPKKVKEGDPEAPPRAWCILVHGLLSDRNEFGDLAMALARQGIGVLALDLPGHGKSGGVRGIYDLARAVEVVEDAKQYLNKRCLDWPQAEWDHAPQQWGLIGHSTGALVALQAAYALHAGDVAVAAAVPRTFGEIRPLRAWGYGLLYRLRRGSMNGDRPGPTVKYPITYKDIFADRGAMAAAKAKGFLQTRIPLRNYPLLISQDGEEIAKGVMDPTLLFVAAGKDDVISRRATRAVYDACSTAKHWMEIEGSGHSMFLDAKRQEVVDQLVGWVSYRLSTFNEVRPGHTKR